HGARPYDEQARVPLFLHLPGDRLAGGRVPDQVSLVDIVPTVADIFDLAPPEGVRGRGLLPLAEDPEGERQALPTFITARPEPSRVPHIRQPLTTSGLVCTIRMPGVKLVEFPMTRSRWHAELFDLAADPGERSNLAEAGLDATLALHTELEAWRVATASGGNLELPALDPEVEEALRQLGYLE
ncbi:MAG TPA: hypothetical protein VLT32_14595, partial [Candidatus Sulfomarinibacteraceae bacterium]|nr:hypothetical protein [Candidatus Sulfomarinibacteraceae bacterium]